MKIVVIALTILLSGCGTMQDAVTHLRVEKEIQAMSRADVIAGIGECEAAGQRAIVLSGKRSINGQIIPVPVEVTCLPKIRW